MSPLTLIAFLLLALIALFFGYIDDKYSALRLGALEGDIIRRFGIIKDMIWSGEAEDIINNEIIELYKAFDFHPKINEYLHTLSEERLNYELGENIRLQRIEALLK